MLPIWCLVLLLSDPRDDVVLRYVEADRDGCIEYNDWETSNPVRECFLTPRQYVVRLTHNSDWCNP